MKNNGFIFSDSGNGLLAHVHVVLQRYEVKLRHIHRTTPGEQPLSFLSCLHKLYFLITREKQDVLKACFQIDLQFLRTAAGGGLMGMWGLWGV
ncbi:hypothetical protein F7725_015102 [Dissostichus mawsoni]|uniref:Uncharacterized protein n=1 Tax=Dissostichus mawsoni TaxID=36200 RepID=A0A7J5YGN6_DISMA|nr:hypothetical protein F7725_015102 [Dissostichus mawsoni]